MNRIVIVDPERSVTFTLRKLLESEIEHILSCNDAATLNDIIAANSCDLIVVNAAMKDHDGHNLLANLIRRLPDTAFVAIIDPGEKKLPVSVRVLDNILKPLDYFTAHDKLVKLIRSGSASELVSGLSLVDYIQVFCLNKMTKAIVASKAGRRGIVLVDQGRVVYAIQDELRGEAAFREIVSWKSPQLKEIRVKKYPKPNIDKDIEHLLLSASQYADEMDGVVADVTNFEEVLTEEPVASISGTAEEKEQVDIEGPAVIAEAGSQPVRRKRRPGRFVAVLAILIALVGVGGYLLYSSKDGMATLVSWYHGLSGAVQALSDKAGNDDSKADQAAPDRAVQNPTGTVAQREAMQQPAATGSMSSAENLGDGAAATQPKIVIKTPVVQAIAPEREDVIFRLHGSNTIGAKLAPALVESYLKERLKAEKIQLQPGEKENESRITARYKGKRIAVEIQAHGSSTGFKDLADNSCDIGMASRKIKEKEVALLSSKGDMTALSSEHVIGLDGIAVIVNRANPLEKIGVEQLRQLFTGQITRWSEIAGTGKDEPVQIYARDDKSGTFDTFKSIVLTQEAGLTESARRYESNAELSDSVSRDSHGIGFTGLPYVRQSKAVAVSDQGAQAILPTFFTVATEDYPISRRLYMYTPANPDNPHVAFFIDYVLSEEGQKIVQETGFVDMNIRSFYLDPPLPETVVDPRVVQEYLDEVKGAQRLSLNFRFRKNSSELDNRSLRDLDRIVRFLSNNPGSRIVLAGFADNSGEYQYNLKLARERAEMIAGELRLRGIVPAKIISCGEEMPVASNITDTGRDKNRRVEVWLQSS